MEVGNCCVEMLDVLERYIGFLLIVNSMYTRILLGIYVRELHRYIRSSAPGRLPLQIIEDTPN